MLFNPLPLRNMAQDKPTVLHVDDLVMNLKLFEATFKKDFDIILCESPKKALNILNEKEVQVLYDNEEDIYLESLGRGFDDTKSLIIKVDVLARESAEEEIKENIGCLGLLIQYKNFSKKKVQLQM